MFSEGHKPCMQRCGCKYVGEGQDDYKNFGLQIGKMELPIKVIENSVDGMGFREKLPFWTC